MGQSSRPGRTSSGSIPGSRHSPQPGLDPNFYSHRSREVSERLPWDHISTGVRRSYLVKEYQASQAGQTRGDCRDQCYACGILPLFNELRAAHPGPAWKCPDVHPHRSDQKPEPVQVD